MGQPAIGSILDRITRAVARSERRAHAAALIRNRLDLIIAYHLAPTNNPRENGEMALVDRIAPHVSRFIDIGANIGYWSLDVLKRVPRAEGVAVEPGLEAMERLRDVLPRQMRIVTAAVSDRAGRTTFYERAGASELSSLAKSGQGAAREVEVITVDGLLERMGWDAVDLLKIDTEGFDGRVLAGATETLRGHRAAVIQFEYNRPWREAGTTLAGVCTLLRDAGYEVLVLRADGPQPFDYSRFGEFFQYANFVAIAPRARGWIAG